MALSPVPGLQPKWTPEHIADICEYFNRAAASVTPGDWSKEDQMLAKLMRVFWAEQKFPVGIKESKKCRVA
jgi:hypothetical protein